VSHTPPTTQRQLQHADASYHPVHPIPIPIPILIPPNGPTLTVFPCAHLVTRHTLDFP
jgi:hypothetical protein